MLVTLFTPFPPWFDLAWDSWDSHGSTKNNGQAEIEALFEMRQLMEQQEFLERRQDARCYNAPFRNGSLVFLGGVVKIHDSL